MVEHARGGGETQCAGRRTPERELDLTAIRRVLDRVLDQMIEHIAHPSRVGPHQWLGFAYLAIGYSHTERDRLPWRFLLRVKRSHRGERLARELGENRPIEVASHPPRAVTWRAYDQ